MIDGLPKLELYKPTPLQQQVEAAVTNGVGINPHYRSEESVLAAQTVLGEMELRQGNFAAFEAVKTMQGMLETNYLVRRGWTAGGEYDDPETLARLVNGVVNLRTIQPVAKTGSAFLKTPKRVEEIINFDKFIIKKEDRRL